VRPECADDARDKNHHGNRADEVVKEDVDEWPHVFDQLANVPHVPARTVESRVSLNVTHLFILCL